MVGPSWNRGCDIAKLTPTQIFCHPQVYQVYVKVLVYKQMGSFEVFVKDLFLLELGEDVQNLSCKALN
jgi:hypothetical protein